MIRFRKDLAVLPATLFDVGRAAGVSVGAALSVRNHACWPCSISTETSVRQPLAEMETRAVGLLPTQLGHRDAASSAVPLPVVFPMDVVPRASVDTPLIVERIVPAR